MTPDLIADVTEVFARRAGMLYDYRSRVLTRPIIGGVFAIGGYEMFSYDTELERLAFVYYGVIHRDSGSVISFEENKQEALAVARLLLTRIKMTDLLQIYEGVRSQHAAKLKAAEDARLDVMRRMEEGRGNKPAHVKRIPRRRREIFDKSNGQCHYCGTALTLDGTWHIEHMMPKALLGGDEPSNLVASCAPCNFKKRDKTDVEFLAKRAAGATQ